MEVIEKEFFSSDLIGSLCDDPIRARKGDRIFVSGNLYAVNYLDYYIEALHKRGADVTVSLFSDRQLYRAVYSGDPEEEATLWMPRPTEGRKVWIKGRGEREFDKMIIMLASPYESGDFAEFFSPEEIPEFRKKIRRFHAAGTRNSWNATRRGIEKIFLDMPSKFLCRSQDLDFEAIMARYQKALGVSQAELIERGEKMAAFFRGGREVRLTCPGGTDLRFRIEGRPWTVGDTAASGTTILQLPGGEIFCAPVENEAEGVLHLAMGKRRCLFQFEKGVLAGIDWLDTPEDQVDRAKAHYAPGEVQLCELGIGTNREARVLPTGPIFEKTYGTVHIGCGCNDTFGGTLTGDRHYDLIVRDPTVILDGKTFPFDN